MQQDLKESLANAIETLIGFEGLDPNDLESISYDEGFVYLSISKNDYAINLTTVERDASVDDEFIPDGDEDLTNMK